MKSTQLLTELRAKSQADLAAMRHDTAEALHVARLDIARGKSKNGAGVRALRKRLARIATVMNQTRS